jgi:hypothetical protein
MLTSYFAINTVFCNFIQLGAIWSKLRIMKRKGRHNSTRTYILRYFFLLYNVKNIMIVKQRENDDERPRIDNECEQEVLSFLVLHPTMSIGVIIAVYCKHQYRLCPAGLLCTSISVCYCNKMPNNFAE